MARKSQREVVGRMISSHREAYTSNERMVYQVNRLRKVKDKWRLNRESRLIAELEAVGNKIDRLAENEAGNLPLLESLWTKQARLLEYVKILDLHSKKCWRRNCSSWQVYMRKGLSWGHRQPKSDSMRCCCKT
jgi:hypothetical protein